MAISIIVPCYNAATTIAATIESALAQTVDRQIIVVDDGSTDGSSDVLRRYGAAIELITGPNQGVSRARNRGLESARQPFVCFLDADDLLQPGTLQARLRTALAADVVVCDWREFGSPSDGADGAVRRFAFETLLGDAQAALARDVWAPPAALLYRRSLAEKIGGFRSDLPVIQDARYLFDAARLGARFVHSEHIGALYRVHPQSLSRRNPAEFWSDVARNGAQIEALWRAEGGLTEARRGVLRAIYDQAARGLLRCGDAGFYEAVAAQRRLGDASLHGRIAEPLGRVLGLPAALRVLAAVGRG